MCDKIRNCPGYNSVRLLVVLLKLELDIQQIHLCTFYVAAIVTKEKSFKTLKWNYGSSSHGMF